MTEQEKRAKVIAELERVADEANPWKESPPLRCDISYPLLIDALTLLKAQEPRVMKADELKTLKKGDVVWLQDKGNPEIIAGIVRGRDWLLCSGVFFTLFTTVDEITVQALDADYQIRWRCWTSRPTDEQREATPW